MENPLKKLLLLLIIISKPPVFLTISILVVIGYLTFVVLNCKCLNFMVPFVFLIHLTLLSLAFTHPP